MQAHRNNVGLLRLIFAGLVIIGHAPEMIDGNRSREPLTMLFHTVSLGELAVDAFFLLSGYLITQSMVRSGSLRSYLERRVLRIFPAYIVAYLLCVFVLAPVVGGHPLAFLPKTFLRLVLLEDPMSYPGQLAGLPYPSLNGSMWTIAYEFRCYLMVAALGVAGVLARKPIVLGLTLAALAASVLDTFDPVRAWVETVAGHGSLVFAALGDPAQALRLTAVFLVGMSVYLYRDLVLPRLTGPVAACAALGAAALMYRNPHFAEAAMTTLGALALFWLAFNARLGPLQRINDDWDISYGVYLYGWPIAILICWLDRQISPVMLAAAALPLALACGAASWWGLESRAKDLVRSRSSSPVARGADLSAPVRQMIQPD